MSSRRAGAALLWALALLLTACGGADRLDDTDAGRTVTYVPGEPILDLDARVLRADAARIDGAAALHVRVAVDPATLVTEADGVDGDAQRARYQLAVVLREATTRRVVRERLWADTLRAATTPELQRSATLHHAVRFPVTPGLYVVEARLDDLGAQREGVRQLRIAVPANAAPGVGRLLIETRHAGGYTAHLSRTMGAPADSLRVRTEVTAPERGATVAFQIEQLPRDTTVARPPHWLGPQRGSLVYQGVRMGAGDVVHRASHEHQGGTSEHAFVVPPLPRGLYRLRVSMEPALEAAGDGSGLMPESPVSEPLVSEPLVSERVLAVFSATHPRVERMAQLIESLAYLAYERERDAILQGETAEERQARFDAFWGGLIGDRRVAANVLRLYYERVEEANRRFSTVKPGWKTDRGMLYVLLGPPTFVEREPNGEAWFYGNGLRQDAAVFSFVEVEDFGQPVGWRPYVLRRQAAYEAVWARGLRQWRSGRVR